MTHSDQISLTERPFKNILRLISLGAYSLSEQDLASGSHVLAGLGGSLVGASLEADDGLAGSQDLVRELPLVLLRRLGSQVRALPFGVPVGLEERYGVSYAYLVIG